MYEILFNYLIYKLNKDIKKEAAETKQVEYIAELMYRENDLGSIKCVFRILKSLAKGKIKDILKPDEILKVEADGNAYPGSFIDIVGSEISLLLENEIKNPKCRIQRYINFNNLILENKLKELKSNQKIHIDITTYFITSIIKKVDFLIKKLTIFEIPKNIVVFYVLLIEDVYLIEKKYYDK